jgi:hypothetical protein
MQVSNAVSVGRKVLSNGILNVMALDAMPRTPNGKLDRKALPVPETAHGSSRFNDAPAGEIEQVVAKVWCGVV